MTLVILSLERLPERQKVKKSEMYEYFTKFSKIQRFAEKNLFIRDAGYALGKLQNDTTKRKIDSSALRR